MRLLLLCTVLIISQAYGAAREDYPLSPESQRRWITASALNDFDLRNQLTPPMPSSVPSSPESLSPLSSPTSPSRSRYGNLTPRQSPRSPSRKSSMGTLFEVSLNDPKYFASLLNLTPDSHLQTELKNIFSESLPVRITACEQMTSNAKKAHYYFMYSLPGSSPSKLGNSTQPKEVVEELKKVVNRLRQTLDNPFGEED